MPQGELTCQELDALLASFRQTAFCQDTRISCAGSLSWPVGEPPGSPFAASMQGASPRPAGRK